MKLQQYKLAMTSAQLAFGVMGCITSVSTAHAVPYALSADGNSVVRITPQTAAPSLNTSLITAAYPGWTVTNGSAAGSSFTTSNYTAGWQGGSGGAKFEGSYSQTNNISPGSQLNYIQTINTNVPLGGATSPYIDPQPNDDTLPFYWTRGEATTHGTARSVVFSDFSRRDPASLSSTKPITWAANLYPVSYDGVTTAVARNGVSWGWTMNSATDGKATATFNAPSPTCPPSTCSGIGTNSITFGTGSPGALSFAGSSFAPKVGDPFKVGTLSYTNGATNIGSSLDSIGLDIALSFDNVPEENFVFHTGLSINNTTNTNDPVASADFVKFTTGDFPATFNVLEGNSASVDLIARLRPDFSIIPGARSGDKDPFAILDLESVTGYSLELVALQSSTSGGFVGGSPAPGNVPEPGTYLLMLIGFLAVGASTTRSSRS